MSTEDLMRFVITEGAVTAVYEYDDDDGWELESQDPNKSYAVVDGNVVETEVEGSYIETKVYQQNSDGDYVRISSTTTLRDDEGLKDDISSQNEYTFIDGQLFELEDSNEYSFDLSLDADYRVGDDLYLVRDGLIYELEDNGFYQKSGQILHFDDERYEIEYYHTQIGDTGSPEPYAKSSTGERREIEDSESALKEDGSIFRLYKAVFDRDPDIPGFKYWGKELDTALNYFEMVISFINSDEFRTNYQDTDDTGFVTKLYNNVLDRAPDDEGLAYWQSELSEGALDRSGVVSSFSESDEFKAATQADLESFIALAGQTSITTDALIT